MTSRRSIAVLLAASALLILARMPQVVIKGRFWAEEGPVFFYNALAFPLRQAVWLPIGGYLNLVANVSGLLARLPPLEFAPYVTIAVGLLFQLMPPVLLLTARDLWLQPLPVRIAAVLLVLLVPASEEVWLQTLHCQFQLALCGAIILALQPAGGVVGLVRLALLLLGPLCGPGAVVLLPLFMARLVVDRTGRRLAECTALGAGCALQMLVFYTPFPMRENALHPTILLTVATVRNLVEPFFGLKAAARAGVIWRADIEAAIHPLEAMVAPLLALAVLGVAMWRGGLKAPGPWLLAAGGMMLAAALFGALGGALPMLAAIYGERYIYVPQALFNLALLSLVAGAGPGWVKAGASVLVVWLLLVGASNYRTTDRAIADGPAWRSEVAAWRADPSHPFAIWPLGWTLQLPRSTP